MNESDGQAQIPIRPFVPANINADVIVNYVIESVTSGIADATLTGANADISDPNGGTITIPIAFGATAAMPYLLPINIIDDLTPEPQENFRLRITSVSGATFNPSSLHVVRVFIAASDNQPTFAISVDDADTAEGDTAVFTVTLGGTAPGAAVTVDWAISGDATAADYTLSGADTDGQLRFTANGDQTLTFAITDDSVREDAETLTVTLSNPSTGSVIGTASATTTIAESDQPHAHSFTFTSPAATITEGAAATTFTVTRTGRDIVAAAGITVTWAYAAATPALVAADFHNDTLPAGGTLVFTGSETTETFMVRTKEDTLNEAGEQFTLTLSIAATHQAAADAEGGAGVPAAHTVTITDDDPITATVTGSASVNEGAAVTTGVTVTLTGGTSTEAVDITYRNAEATGSVSIPAGMTTGMLELTAVDDAVSEGSEMLSLVAGDFTATSAGTVTVAVSGAPTLTINADSDDDITVTITPPAGQAATGRAAEFAVRMSGASAADVTVTYSVTLTVDGAAVTIPAGNITDTVSPIAAGARGGVISVRVPADVSVAQSGSLGVTLTGVTVASGGGTAMLGAAASAEVAVSSDDPAARAARLEAPLASAGRGVGQLAAQAIQRRLAAGASANSLTLAGRDFAGDTEILAAEYLAGGHETPAADLLRQSGFSLAHADSGINFWGGGGHVSAKGDHAGIAYDGGTTAFHLGADTVWKTGLLGIAIARSNSDMAFNNTDNLETTVTSVHPYLTRKFGEVQLWTTVGRGTGDAELKEPDAVIKTDVTVTTAAIGAVYAPAAGVSLSADGVYTRAQLDAAQSAGRRLPKVTADALRLNAAAELSGRRDAWRSFLIVNLRHDAGDGDTGSAGDVGGGVEWQSPTVHLRLEGAKYLAGSGAEEERLTFAARKNAGRLNLGLNLGVHNGVDTANLLSGEWKF